MNGLALVEIKRRRREDSSEKGYRKEMGTIKDTIRKVPGVRGVRELKQRLRGDSHVPTFKFTAGVRAADLAGLKRVFQEIDRRLHAAGHSHVEGYEA